MQIFTIPQIIEMYGTVHNTVSTMSIAIFNTLLSNIAISFHDLFAGNHKVASALMILSTLIALMRFAKKRKLDFLRSIFS